MGVADGYSISLIASSHYTPAQTATPVFTPASGPITNGTSVSISCTTPGAVIFYTVDGTVPTTNSSVYTVPLTINGGKTVSAIGAAKAYLNSAVQSVLYSLVRTETPVFSPPPGSVPYGTTISITCATPGSIIRYTLDGTAPTNTSPRYSTPLPIHGDVSLSAIGLAQFHLNSVIQSGFYTLVRNTVVTTVAGGPVAGLSNGLGTSARFSSSQRCVR